MLLTGSPAPVHGEHLRAKSQDTDAVGAEPHFATAWLTLACLFEGAYALAVLAKRNAVPSLAPILPRPLLA